MHNDAITDELEQSADAAAERADAAASREVANAQEAVKLDRAMQAGDDAATIDIDRETLDPDSAIAAVEENVALVVQQAGDIEITSQVTYEAAAEFLTGTLKPALREINETFGDIVQAAHAAHKVALAKRKKYEQPVLDAELIVKGAMGTYHHEQTRIAEAEERKRLDAARKEAEDRAVEEAARLESAGKKEAAAERLAAPVAPVVTTPAPASPKAAGTSVRTKTKFRIVSEAKIGRAYLSVDKKKIGQVVRAMGVDAEELVGGIEVYEEPVISASVR